MHRQPKPAFELKLREGWKPQPKTKGAKEQVLTVMQALEQGAENKAAQGCSARFIKDTRRVITLWRRYEAEHSIRNLTLEELKPVHIRAFLVRPNWSPKTQRTVKSTIGTLLSDCKPGIVERVKLKKPSSSLHKPFDDIKGILDDIADYNGHLHLCCLITYGCLLRPHREIRELRWDDFSDDYRFIHLSGHRNKSGRNRIVPVPGYVKDLLVPGEPGDNIFSGKEEPYNEEYFKTLWSPFERIQCYRLPRQRCIRSVAPNRYLDE